METEPLYFWGRLKGNIHLRHDELKRTARGELFTQACGRFMESRDVESAKYSRYLFDSVLTLLQIFTWLLGFLTHRAKPKSVWIKGRGSQATQCPVLH